MAANFYSAVSPRPLQGNGGTLKMQDWKKQDWN